MRLKQIFVGLSLLIGLTAFLPAQVKIGYTNVTAIVALMPETKAADEELLRLDQSLSQSVQIKQDYAQTVYQKYLDYTQSNETPDEKRVKQMEDELNRLQQEIQKETENAQVQLSAKRQDLMHPILEKVQKSIKKIAAAENYAYILNTVDGSGSSIVLHAPPEHDLSEKILKDLGIEIPEEVKLSN
jgi:outer membrane protein